MSDRPRLDIPLLGGLAVSLILHAMALTPFVSVLSAPSDVTAVSARFEPELLDERRPLPMDELVGLGIDESKHSSLAWVGYDEYQKHLAQLAEIEQAAFRESTAAPAETPPMVDVTARIAADAIPDHIPADPSAADGAEETQPDDSALAKVEEPTRESAVATDATPRAVADPAVVEAALPLFRQFIEAALTAGAASRQAQDAPRDEREVRAPETGPASAAPPGPKAIEPNPPAPRPGSEAEVGAAAHKESDPTSLIEVPVDMLGQPIAREGLELEPRRPRFPPLLRVTGVFGNPLVEIRFGRDGKPAEAVILESSGDGRVDHAIGVSLYRWRAKGAALESLAPDETLSVRLRIILNPRARR